MKAIRINTIIDPSTLRFEEVKGLKGKRAEIIILIDETNQPDPPPAYNAAGALSEHANVDKVAEEESAWEKHSKQKYGIR